MLINHLQWQPFTPVTHISSGYWPVRIAAVDFHKPENTVQTLGLPALLELPRGIGNAFVMERATRDRSLHRT
jgi:hypothetical protein